MTFSVVARSERRLPTPSSLSLEEAENEKVTPGLGFLEGDPEADDLTNAKEPTTADSLELDL